MSDVKIKICGLFRLYDAQLANAAMPDYAGYVFYPNSRRNVSFEAAQALRRALDARITTVGVFVDAPLDEIVRLYQQGTIDIIQLHGGESEAYIFSLKQRLPQAEIWKAFKIRCALDITRAQKSPADKILLDNGYGTGECFDWTLIAGITRPFILAGGLTPENISQAAARYNPFAVDLSSGVETNGIKDAEKILAAVAAVRGC